MGPKPTAQLEQSCSTEYFRDALDMQEINHIYDVQVAESKVIETSLNNKFTKSMRLLQCACGLWVCTCRMMVTSNWAPLYSG